ncbi:MAG: hypothetical protein MZV70_38615 [Desulfobacterales bacterium]|nr:hypothetical protein [Desulfobacterales bacterium]
MPVGRKRFKPCFFTFFAAGNSLAEIFANIIGNIKGFFDRPGAMSLSRLEVLLLPAASRGRRSEPCLPGAP